jgi:hypothetical protein
MENTRLSMSRSVLSSGLLRLVFNKIALSCPRWSPYGEVDVLSFHIVYACFSSSAYMVASMGGTLSSGRWLSSVDVASDKKDCGTSTLPLSRRFEDLFVPYGPYAVTIGYAVNGVPSAWLKCRWFRAVKACSMGSRSTMEVFRPSSAVIVTCAVGVGICFRSMVLHRL